MAKTFMQIAEEAMAEVDGISAEEVQQRMQQDTNALLVDVRDAADIPSTGLVPGGLNISLGMLPVKADLELPEQLREPGLQDRSRQIITTCQLGPNAARGAKLLQDMGFTNVAYMDGGMAAWKAADLPTE
jgi:rhodanese-related sulfurtransferase